MSTPHSESSSGHAASTGGTRPRICHLSTRLVKGGADFNIFYNLLHSAPRFAQTLVIGAEYDQSLVGQLREVGVDVVVIPAIQREISPLQELKAFAALRRFFRDRPFDIIYTHNAKTGILGRFAAPRAGVFSRLGAHLLRRPADGCLCSIGVGTPEAEQQESGAQSIRQTAPRKWPVIVHGLHGMSFTDTDSRARYLLFRSLERAAARRTDHFVSVGYTIRDLMLAAGIGRPEQYRIIRSGMDIERFKRAPDDGAGREALRRALGCGPQTVLFAVVARIEQRKGQYRFLQAFARAFGGQRTLAAGNGGESDTRNVTAHKVRAAIVGDGADRANCEALADELGITNLVEFTGFRDNAADYFAAADVVCLSSEWEGVPQSLVQAAAVGRPAVAFDVPGIREILSDGRTGIVVPYPDTEAFAAALQRLAADSELRAAYGGAAGTRDLTEFRLENMVAGTEALYNELLQPLILPGRFE